MSGATSGASAVAPFPLPRAARIAVFASGRGSNLASLLAAFPPGAGVAADDTPGRVALVVSNVPDAPALGRAREADVPTVAVAWRRGEGSREAFEREVQAALDRHGIDLICLAGFMRILSPAFTARWSGRVVNIHPSLLPAFRGLHAQRQALAAGARESGCTVHLVDAGVDTGRILLQRRVPVRPGDTEATLSERILEQEHRAYPDAVRALLRGAAPADAAGDDDGRSLEETR
jgi:phosphoribosylglycinamide formyltransferase-1